MTLVDDARTELDHLVSEAGSAEARDNADYWRTLTVDYVALLQRVKDDTELCFEMVMGIDRMIAAHLGVPLSVVRHRMRGMRLQ
jgi:hypothetical protein